MKIKANCPFAAASEMVDRIKPVCDAIFLDFHAETTSEKVSMAWHLDGRVQAVVGTHTHIPTNDARIFPKGLAFLSDAGMTGALSTGVRAHFCWPTAIREYAHA